MAKGKKTGKSDAERSKRYRARKRDEKESLRAQLAAFMAMTPQQIHSIMGYKPVNMHIFASLAQAQCTKGEIAAGLGMTLETLNLRMAENPMLGEILTRAQMYGRASLRRKQWDVGVVMGHPRMLEWLGKQVLGQTDKVEQVEQNNHEAFIRRMQEGMPEAYDVTPPTAAPLLDMDANPELEPA